MVIESGWSRGDDYGVGMSDQVVKYGGQVVVVVSPDGPPIKTDQDVVDLIGSHYFDEVEWFALPVERLDEAFFGLSSRIAGGLVQRFVMYGHRLAIIGDISHHLADSSNLRAFVAEANRGRQVWFLPDLTTLTDRLTA